MILDEIKEILADRFEITADSIEPETDLAEDLGAGELDMVDIGMDIEDQYSIEVSQETLESIKTVEDLVTFVKTNLD